MKMSMLPSINVQGKNDVCIVKILRYSPYYRYFFFPSSSFFSYRECGDIVESLQNNGVGNFIYPRDRLYILWKIGDIYDQGIHAYHLPQNSCPGMISSLQSIAKTAFLIQFSIMVVTTVIGLVCLCGLLLYTTFSFTVNTVVALILLIIIECIPGFVMVSGLTFNMMQLTQDSIVICPKTTSRPSEFLR